MKPQLALNLATSVKDNKNDFLNTLMAKAVTRKTSVPYGGNMVTKDEEMAEVLNPYFASVVPDLLVWPDEQPGGCGNGCGCFVSAFQQRLDTVSHSIPWKSCIPLLGQV